MKKIMIIGATGMLGSALVRYFAGVPDIQVLAMARQDSASVARRLGVSKEIIKGESNLSIDSVLALSGMSLFSNLHKTRDSSSTAHTLPNAVEDYQPDILINAVGVIKHHASGNDIMEVVPMNTLLPHVLARVCKEFGVRLIQLSTDCVFSGAKGRYVESDVPDALDLYGRSKYMGEIHDQRHVITLRTSFIGHELTGQKNLLEWFLAQKTHAKGFRKAIYSGLPTVELARLIEQYVLPRPDLHGLYHVSADPINKFDLICEIARCYDKSIEIEAVDEPIIDRSLDSTKFRQVTGFVPQAWPEMIRRMHAFG